MRARMPIYFSFPVTNDEVSIILKLCSDSVGCAGGPCTRGSSPDSQVALDRESKLVASILGAK